MTLSTIARQLWRCSLYGQFDGEKLTYSHLYNRIAQAFRDPRRTAYYTPAILRDGKEWWIKIIRRPGRGTIQEYDYIVPDTPEQSERFHQELLQSETKAGT